MEKASVIIPTYNAAKYIEDAINSVLNQSYKNIELIICDDGSTDDTRELIKKYGSRIIYVYQKNYGCAAARNKAISIASGELIAFLDSDDKWLPEKLQKQVDLLERNKEICLAFSDAYIINEEGKRSRSLFEIYPPHSGMVFKQLVKENFIPVLTAIVRKKVFKEIGLFNPRYKIAEDWELFLRIARQYPVTFINQPLAEYRIHPGNLSRQKILSHKEVIYIINKYIPLMDKNTAIQLKIKKYRFQIELAMLFLHRIMGSKRRQ